MKIRDPVEFLYPQLKLQEAEVEAMAKFWLRSIRNPNASLSLVEEALLYGAKTNPMQCFRVVRKICEKTYSETILKNVAVDLLEELVAYSALKIKRRLLQECKINRNFKLALSHVYLSKRDSGYYLVKSVVKEFHYL